MLLIEDNADERRAYSVRLREKGWSVVELESGENALTWALALVPDIIVTDLKMPGVDGTEAMRQLKSDPRTAHIEVIVLSGFAERSGDAYGAGCHTFLSKPCLPETLIEIMDAIRMDRPSVKLRV